MFNTSCNVTPVNALKQHWVQQKFSFIKNPRPNYGIMLLNNGEIHFKSASGTLKAKSGDIIFLPKNSCYEANFILELGEIDNYLINFESNDIVSDCTEPVLLAKGITGVCYTLFKNFVEENYNTVNADFKCKGMFYLLLSAVMNENNVTMSKTDRALEKAKQRLLQDDNCSIQTVARECFVSESGLRKIFKENLGVSPVKFRINEKINKAKFLLESTDMSVDEIADKLNFFDTAYFCKTFYNSVGVSPGKYSRNKKL